MNRGTHLINDNVSKNPSDLANMNRITHLIFWFLKVNMNRGTHLIFWFLKVK